MSNTARMNDGLPNDALSRLDVHARTKGRYANARPKDAASLIILDRSGPAPKVLLGRRHEAQKFMPGKFVFPGGRLEPLDRLMPAARELDPRVKARLAAPPGRATAGKARGLALAAIRETFEETGLLLGVKGERAPKAPGGLWSAFAEAKILPDLSTLHYVARAITPPGRSRRFDTRFFAIDAAQIAHRVDGVVGPQAELVELCWVPIAETGPLGLPTITAVVLEELEARARAGLGHSLPVPFYRVRNGRFTRELL
jgi:8-oxo-dGTP pyrophosphatase MutT (NUDIX family)